ncbi:MAG TPA: hypothetical protein VL175_03380 [Pirellulales bacterium]|jgi:tetratricopeptide (TPR) repeat protein|nr:hypothetical protein [Pirellulales bacterium]
MRLVSYVVGAGLLAHLLCATTSAGAPKTLALKAQEPELRQPPHRGGSLLVREIARQAVLLAAREEMGLSTRDMALRESMPAEGDCKTVGFKVTGHFTAALALRLEWSQSVSDSVEHKIEITEAWPPAVFDYSQFANRCEALSREALVASLTKAGFESKARKPAGTAELSTQVERQLSEMNLLSQFAALRALHQQIRNEGESPQTLAGLVRGYANLGRLTTSHWSAFYKVFFARALLYAERLVNLDKQSMWSLQHRAYGKAMCGLHAAALKDLEFAAQADKEAKSTTDSPAWLPIVAGLCRYDLAAIQAVDNKDVRQLAAFCSYLVVEHSNCESLSLRIGREALKVAPECYAICDSMNRYRGVSNRHFTTVFGAQVLTSTLPDRLGDMPGLPPALVREIGNLKPPERDQESLDAVVAPGVARADLVASLIDRGAADKDPQEMSWELLGRLIEEQTFLQVFNRMDFLAHGLGLPLESFRAVVEAGKTVVGPHPSAGLLWAIVVDPQRSATPVREILDKTNWVDAGLPQYRVAVQLRANIRANGPGINRETMRSILLHADAIAPDLEQSTLLQPQATLSQQLLAVSPHSPQAIAGLVLNDPAVTQAQLEKWENDFKQHATVWRSLALRYQQLGRWSDTERCTKRYVELAPDQWGFETLANAYWQQKKPDKWKETLDQSLEYEDFGLAHARSRVMIANWLMSKKHSDEALPYAEAAAATGAAWAMLCAAECNENLEHWEQAEKWTSTTSQRYPAQEFEWFFWCCRTGKGDRKSAAQLAEQTAEGLEESDVPNDHERLGVYYLLKGDKKKAREQFRSAHERSKSPWPGMQWALLASEAGDLEERDRAIESVIRDGKNYRSPDKNNFSELVELAQWMNNVWHDPEMKQPDLEAIDEICKKSPGGRSNVEFYTGCLLRDRGDKDKGEEYWQRAKGSGRHNYWNVMIASQWLRH